MNNSLLDFFNKNHGLAVGSPAPSLKATDQDGLLVDLAEAYSLGPVFFYFYVRAGTPVCTMHACHFRDGYEELRALGVQIFGVSSDSLERLKKFKANQRLPFRLLSDADGAIAAAFQVPSLFGLTARDAYLVRDGVVAWKGHASARPAVIADALKNVSAESGRDAFVNLAFARHEPERLFVVIEDRGDGDINPVSLAGLVIVEDFLATWPALMNRLPHPLDCFKIGFFAL